MVNGEWRIVFCFHHLRAMRGSKTPYKISTRILIATNTDAANNTEPMSTGKSFLFNASTVSFPIPFQPKIISIKKAPANISANQPDTAVSTGFKALRNACLNTTFVYPNPFALAVRT